MIPTPALDFARTPVTLTVTAIALAIELVCTLDPDGARREYLYNDLQLGIWLQVWDGQPWRAVTTTLLHGSLLHAAFNIYWMLIFGAAIETRFGPPRFLALFVLLAVVSTMAQYLLVPKGAVGLSGVVYGLFGLLWVGRRYEPDWYWSCNDQTVQVLMIWFCFCFVLSYFGMPIANIAHGAGLAMGALLAMATFARQHRWAWRGGAALLALPCVASLLGVPGHSEYEKYRLLLQYRQDVQALDQLRDELEKRHGRDVQVLPIPAKDSPEDSHKDPSQTESPELGAERARAVAAPTDEGS